MNLKNVSQICCVLILSWSCANIHIKDGEWCADAGPEGASCFRTLSHKERDIPKETWDTLAIGPDYRFGKVCTDVDNFGEWLKAILKLCRLTRRCTYDSKTKMIAFVDRAQSIKFNLEKTYYVRAPEDDEEEESSIAREPHSEIPKRERTGEENSTGSDQAQES